MKLLLVDDDADVLLIVSRAFRELGGHDVLEESDAEHALERARREGPDAIITDCVMPGLDGPAFVARLEADPATRDIPVIFLTGKTREEDKQRLLATGAVGIIEKPFDFMALPATVEQMLSGSGRRSP